MLLLRGLAIELLLAGSHDPGGAISSAQRYWSLVLWNPWFVVGGIAFLMAARSRQERRGGERLRG